MAALASRHRWLGGLAAGMLLFAALAQGREPTEITVTERSAVTADRLYGDGPPGVATHRLALTLVHFEGGDWSREAIAGAVREVGRILGQCGVRLTDAGLVRVAAPRRFHDLDTPVSRALVRALALPKPTVYFVADTRHEPAFDAEAMGRGNTRRRPELADTVWMTRAVRDPGIALAHELVHVLMDSGEHVELPDNLMREDTAPGHTRLTEAQCARLREVGERNSLLHAGEPEHRSAPR